MARYAVRMSEIVLDEVRKAHEALAVIRKKDLNATAKYNLRKALERIEDMQKYIAVLLE